MLLSGHSANDLYLSMFKQKVRLKLDIDLLDINFVKFLFRDGIISYVSKESLVEPLTLREKDKKANYTSKRYFKKPLISLFDYYIININSKRLSPKTSVPIHLIPTNPTPNILYY